MLLPTAKQLFVTLTPSSINLTAEIRKDFDISSGSRSIPIEFTSIKIGRYTLTAEAKDGDTLVFHQQSEVDIVENISPLVFNLLPFSATGFEQVLGKSLTSTLAAGEAKTWEIPPTSLLLEGYSFYYYSPSGVNLFVQAPSGEMLAERSPSARQGSILSATAKDPSSSPVYLTLYNPESSDVEVVLGSIPSDYTSVNIGLLKGVPAGTFQRDATDTNTSTVSAFRMSEKEITRAQFLAIMGTDPSDTVVSSGLSDPVQQVNWYQAITFCNKLSLAEGLNPVFAVTGVDFATLTYTAIPTTTNTTWNAVIATWANDGYRLPTEMEWMWAAMGATSDRSNGYMGTGINTLGYQKSYAGSLEARVARVFIDSYAWSNHNSTGKTHPAGAKTANELGFYDMSGNVWE